MESSFTIKKTCPICSFEPAIAFETSYYTICRCTNVSCGHYFALDPPPGSGVCEFNPKKDYDYYKQRNQALIRTWHSHRFISPDSQLLDVGSGSGHILETLRDTYPRISITSVEPSITYQDHLRKSGFNVYSSLSAVDTKSFDGVLLIEVIEHMDRPLEALMEIRKIIRKNAQVFITTPAGDVRKGHPRPQELAAYHNISHVQFFTEKSLKKCLRLAGFKVIKFKFIPELYPNHVGLSKKDSLKLVLRNKYLHLRGQTTHLTYYCS